VNLLNETKRLVKKHRKELTVAQMADRSGVGRFWMQKFVQDIPPDPGVKKVQKVYDYLSRRDHAMKVFSQDSDLGRDFS
jgi:predicted transcriptional regulator